MKNRTKVWACLALALPSGMLTLYSIWFTVPVGVLILSAFSLAACYCGVCYFTDEICIRCGNDLMPGFSGSRSFWSRITTAKKVEIASGYSYCKECLEEEGVSK